jgi:hypothetical protein
LLTVSAGAEVDGPNLVAFAFDDCHALVEVKRVDAEAAGFADPYAAVQQEPDECFVAAVVELSTVAGFEQCGQLVVADHGYGFHLQRGWREACHWIAREFVFFDEPAAESEEAAVSDFDRSGFVSVVEHSEPFADGGSVEFVEGGFAALGFEPS